MISNFTFFETRLYEDQSNRSKDNRSPFQRDRARIMHSAAFRRLQGKTQVMGTGEGDFHRTRLTHSIEVAQIGYGLLEALQFKKATFHKEAQDWLPPRDLIEAACLAHDLGHPPFGHKGEQALHSAMLRHGGFEGNGQTLRILTKLEKYKKRGKGLYPTRRLVLGILKYPRSMGSFDLDEYATKPPKSFHEDEVDVVEWAFEGFAAADKDRLIQSADGNGAHHSLDCSILELADDIAYGIHDIEDIVARGLATASEVQEEITKAFKKIDISCLGGFDAKSVCEGLLADSFQRKQMISGLVNLFITSVTITEDKSYEHPLLRFNAALPDHHHKLLKALKGLAYELVIRKAKVQQLERRGQMVVAHLFDTLLSDPVKLIPQSSWQDGCIESSKERRVCDYIAGMTDSYAERLYKRLFTPGFGSSGDEL
ncbi:anti-phage deoxyguanosine triphosphatase [Tritonibacter mobilis]|uniref:anti-phage deoxyguanosine triphosphatase n=1 Tax=Tritonibacter mobilis TaxID=379347 RepID=UPI001C083996|nr:anti-phage deoxyguanosine triphosphatase [Tritonibacter mobilis]MBU3033650.1 dGTPase [Tritonibacter mobilis]WHQ84374.1 anti-phage deoxyguanosine triphosphatase [Tritonibacter mobilis]